MMIFFEKMILRRVSKRKENRRKSMIERDKRTGALSVRGGGEGMNMRSKIEIKSIDRIHYVGEITA